MSNFCLRDFSQFLKQKPSLGGEDPLGCGLGSVAQNHNFTRKTLLDEQFLFA
jgi:hypothetical protein